MGRGWAQRPQKIPAGRDVEGQRGAVQRVGLRASSMATAQAPSAGVTSRPSGDSAPVRPAPPAPGHPVARRPARTARATAGVGRPGATSARCTGARRRRPLADQVGHRGIGDPGRARRRAPFRCRSSHPNATIRDPRSSHSSTGGPAATARGLQRHGPAQRVRLDRGQGTWSAAGPRPARSSAPARRPPPRPRRRWPVRRRRIRCPRRTRPCPRHPDHGEPLARDRAPPRHPAPRSPHHDGHTRRSPTAALTMPDRSGASTCERHPVGRSRTGVTARPASAGANG